MITTVQRPPLVRTPAAPSRPALPRSARRPRCRQPAADGNFTTGLVRLPDKRVVKDPDGLGAASHRVGFAGSPNSSGCQRVLRFFKRRHPPSQASDQRIPGRAVVEETFGKRSQRGVWAAQPMPVRLCMAVAPRIPRSGSRAPCDRHGPQTAGRVDVRNTMCTPHIAGVSQRYSACTTARCSMRSTQPGRGTPADRGGPLLQGNTWCVRPRDARSTNRVYATSTTAWPRNSLSKCAHLDGPSSWRLVVQALRRDSARPARCFGRAHRPAARQTPRLSATGTLGYSVPTTAKSIWQRRRFSEAVDPANRLSGCRTGRRWEEALVALRTHQEAAEPSDKNPSCQMRI